MHEILKYDAERKPTDPEGEFHVSYRHKNQNYHVRAHLGTTRNHQPIESKDV